MKKLLMVAFMMVNLNIAFAGDKAVGEKLDPSDGCENITQCTGENCKALSKSGEAEDASGTGSTSGK